MNTKFVAIVDYGLGNLFSVREACKAVGIHAMITASRDDIERSAGVILTGVGAFGTAMKHLTEKGLIDVLREYARSSRPLVGICLGMQLLMTESFEFGCHAGLDIIPGTVIKLQTDPSVKVPHVGWNRIQAVRVSNKNVAWNGTLLEGIPDGAAMYFVHSYHVQPQREDVVFSVTQYGPNEFCSSLQTNNISAFQFHPECSGRYGLAIYRNLAKKI